MVLLIVLCLLCLGIYIYYAYDDTKCMCKEFREQESGWCHCGLYYKEKDT